MSDRWSWIRLCSKCERLYTKYGSGVSVPDDNPEDEDPLDVFDDTDVEQNVMRFVVYILWLKQQPDSFEKYLEVRKQRFDLWRQCVYKVWIL